MSQTQIFKFFKQRPAGSPASPRRASAGAEKRPAEADDPVGEDKKARLDCSVHDKENLADSSIVELKYKSSDMPVSKDLSADKGSVKQPFGEEIAMGKSSSDAKEAPADDKVAKEAPANDKVTKETPADDKVAKEAPADDKVAKEAPDKKACKEAPVDDKNETAADNKDVKAPQLIKKSSKPQQQQLLMVESKPETDEQLLSRLKAVRAATHGLVSDFGPSWFRPLQAEFGKPYFAKLAEFVRNERARGVVYPPPAEVFSWTRACRMQDVKVVILGQDPYHGPNQAHGLCFSVRRPTPAPPSLLNIFREAQSNFPKDFQLPGHGDLTGWAEQGVLLLNAVLTVRRGEANSHKDKGWEAFTDAVVSALNTRCSGLVFILWGSYAQKKGARIDKRKHKVIVGAHPSPLAANRGGFFGKMYFKEANEYLKSIGKALINWSRLP